MTETQTGGLDMTMMLAFHAGFRRDADRLAKAGENLAHNRASVVAGWESFRDQLERHHLAEDEDLWPVARAHLAGKPDELAQLDSMESEHAAIDPLIESVNTVLAHPHTGREQTAHAIASLRDAVLAHLAHEERDVLPLLDRVVTPKEWRTFSDLQRRKSSVGDAARLFPWLADGNTPEGLEVLRRLPAPMRLANRYIWTRQYNKTARW